MKRSFSCVLCGVATSLLTASAAACLGQTLSIAPADQQQAPARPAQQRSGGSEASRPTTFAGTNPWSEPPAPSPEPIRPAPAARPAQPVQHAAVASEPPAPRTANLVSEDDVSASIRGLALQAAHLTSEGLRLAGKGATFSARAKFVSALELIADGLDAKHKTRFHSKSLAAGLLALREADDFARADASGGAAADPVNLAVSHSTPVLRRARRDAVTRLQALQLYYSYATSQLASAVGSVPEASMALYHLGRLQPFLGQSVERTAVLAEPKALAIEQAAVLVDPQNFRAANELGVLLARCGQLDSARKAFLYSASLERRPETFQNLATVYRALGDRNESASMALLAAAERKRHPGSTLQTGSGDGAKPLIYLVDHKTFAGETQTVAATDVPPAPSGPATKTGDPNLNAPPANAYPPDAYAGSGAPGPEFLQPLCWEVFAQGEYIGPARTAQLPEYFLRVDDQVGFVFRLTGRPTSTPYRLNVGDVIRIGSLTTPSPALETPIEPDGTIVMPQIGPVAAAGKSIEDLRNDLEQRYRQFIKEPAITIVPISVNKTVEELRNAISNRSGIFAGQAFHSKVTPNGAVQLPAIGSVPAQGLTLAELRGEIEQRYSELVSAVEVTPVLTDRAPHSVYVLGEVQKPGKFAMDAPTTVLQAIAMAGSWNIGGNVKSVIVFRRDEEWRLMATRVNVRPALYNSRMLQADDIWLRDNDIVIVPKYPIQVFDDWVNLIFTRGIYGVVPVQGISLSFFRDLSTVGSTIVQ